MTAKWLPYKILDKLRGRSGWKMLEAEDALFQKLAVSLMRPQLASVDQGICFCHSYMALEPFRAAKKAGWKVVLGQIDLGEAEWDIVDNSSSDYRDWEPIGERPSANYWRKWREETELADLIIANSEWSAESLVRQGIPAGKLRVVPLLYEPSTEQAAPKTYPEAYSVSRPLRMLFLGGICQRKGVAPLLEAIRLLGDAHVHLRLIGPRTIVFPGWVDALVAEGKVTVEPPVKGEAVNAAYQWADLFLLPTYSDGFAITQLEAQARKLPVIASRHCAAVVRDKVNGRLLMEVTPEVIADCLRDILENSAQMGAWSENSAVPADCRLERLMETYRAITGELDDGTG